MIAQRGEKRIPRNPSVAPNLFFSFPKLTTLNHSVEISLNTSKGVRSATSVSNAMHSPLDAIYMSGSLP